MCEIMQTCENQNMFHGHQVVMFVGIMVLYFCIFSILYYIDRYYSTRCTYSIIPRHYN